MVILFTLIFLALSSALSAWVLSRIFIMKGRSASAGALLGGVTGIFPILSGIVTLIAFVLPGPKAKLARAQATPMVESNRSIEDRLADLGKLKEKGVISDADFEKTKGAILAAM